MTAQQTEPDHSEFVTPSKVAAARLLVKMAEQDAQPVEQWVRDIAAAEPADRDVDVQDGAVDPAAVRAALDSLSGAFKSGARDPRPAISGRFYRVTHRAQGTPAS
jgi:hypothetical protein